MSISISWRIVSASANRIHGTSNDWSVYERVFGRRYLTSKDFETLNAMHLATGLKESLWNDLASVVEELPEGTEIEVNAYW